MYHPGAKWEMIFIFPITSGRGLHEAPLFGPKARHLLRVPRRTTLPALGMAQGGQTGTAFLHLLLWT